MLSECSCKLLFPHSTALPVLFLQDETHVVRITKPKLPFSNEGMHVSKGPRSSVWNGNQDLPPEIPGFSCMTPWMLHIPSGVEQWQCCAYHALAISTHPRGFVTFLTFIHEFMSQAFFIFKRRVVARLKWVCFSTSLLWGISWICSESQRLQTHPLFC